MGPLDSVIHLANFAAPALFLALVLALLGRWLAPAKGKSRALWAVAAVNFAAGLAVLAAGLWFFGRDGKMATYAALVIVMGTSQWLAGHARRR